MVAPAAAAAAAAVVPSYPAPVSVLEQKALLDAQRQRITRSSVNSMLSTVGLAIDELPARHPSAGVGNDVFFLTAKVLPPNTNASVSASTAAGNGPTDSKLASSATATAAAAAATREVVLRLTNPHPHYRTRKTRNEVLALEWVRANMPPLEPSSASAAATSATVSAGRVSIPIPEVIACSWDGATSPLAGVEFVLLSRVRGVTLHDLLPKLTLAEFRICCQQLSAVLRGFQRLPPLPAIGSFTLSEKGLKLPASTPLRDLVPHITIGPYLMDSVPLGPFARWSELIRSYTDYALAVIAARPDLAAYRATVPTGCELFDRTVVAPYAQQHESKSTAAAASASHEYRLLHGDLNVSNIMIDPQTLELTGVLDWEKANAGPPHGGFDFHDTHSWCDEWMDEGQRREKAAAAEGKSFDRVSVWGKELSALTGFDDIRSGLHKYLFPTAEISEPNGFGAYHVLHTYNIQLQSIVWNSATWYDRLPTPEERAKAAANESVKAYAELRDTLAAHKCWPFPDEADSEAGTVALAAVADTKK